MVSKFSADPKQSDLSAVLRMADIFGIRKNIKGDRCKVSALYARQCTYNI
jgi:hypothetical protein